jgi:hypothetical protein
MSNDPARARAEAVFKVVETTPETRADAMSEYRASQEAARLRMAEQRAARLARAAATPAPARRRGKGRR